MGPASVSAMPSPRWPMRAMASRSITLRPEQELAIAVAAEDRGGNEIEDAPAERGDKARQRVADLGMDLRIANDALLDMLAAGFELRLDQGDESCRRPGQRQGRGQNEPERDEAHVDDHQLGRRREPARRQRA